MARHQIIQLTDLHLFSDPQTRLRGVPTYECWKKVLEHIDHSNCEPDLLILTGDLAHDERLSTYLQLRRMLEPWLQRLLVIPGNHDNRQAMREVFPHQFDASSSPPPFVTFARQLGQWLLVGLDSHIPGEVNGMVDQKQLDWFDRVLDSHAELGCLLFVHHPPSSVQSPWLDKLGMYEPERIEQFVRAKPQIVGIVAGHVHQDFAGRLAGRPLLATPSTAMQFKPGECEPAYDPIAPGYRVIDLDGIAWSSRVVRLPELAHPPSVDSSQDVTE